MNQRCNTRKNTQRKERKEVQRLNWVQYSECENVSETKGDIDSEESERTDNNTTENVTARSVETFENWFKVLHKSMNEWKAVSRLGALAKPTKITNLREQDTQLIWFDAISYNSWMALPWKLLNSPLRSLRCRFADLAGQIFFFWFFFACRLCQSKVSHFSHKLILHSFAL